MVFAADTTGIVLALVAVLGVIATWVSLFLSRKSSKESARIQQGTAAATKQLNEVNIIRQVVQTLESEVDRLQGSLRDANDLATKLNTELVKAQRNITTLRNALDEHEIPTPELEPVLDV